MAKYNTEWEYLVHLLSSVLKGEKPDELPEKLSFQRLFSLASFHSVANMAYYGIEQLLTRPDKDLTAKWSEVRDKEIMKDITQQMEMEQLSAAFSAAGVKFVTVKGAVLKGLYPQSDFRTMSDIDIYINDKDTEAAKKTMLSLGYVINRLEHGVHDVYYKQPVMNIEIHRDLFGEGGNEFAPIFADLWGKSAPVSGTHYELTPEYCLAYVIAHGIKHYQQGGTGIRTFMDIHVYRQHHTGLDIEQIYELFAAVGAREMCEDFVRLSEIWFEGAEFTKKYRKMTEYIIRGGTYGTFENQTIYGVEKNGKAKFVLSRIFPSLSYTREQFPILRRLPFLLPVFWVVRWVKAFTVNRRQNMEKLRALKNKK